MKTFLLRAVPALCVSIAALAAEPFRIAPGDRVLFMGDGLLEREGSAAALEWRMTRSASGIPFTSRNLSFSADLPTGVSRASFGPAASGMERVREQLELVKPTVAVLGFGMAASLEEMTYAAKDPNLNADPTRYGSEFSASKFKADLGALMDEIQKASGGKPVRFVLLAPLRHEDLRGQRPGLPDPAAHNALLSGYTTALRELASARGARFVDTAAVVQRAGDSPLTDNGIHPSTKGLEVWAERIAAELGWSGGAEGGRGSELRKALQRKNELFFHRWRPANHTYIFGFRKREQGRNAVEIEQFDSLLEGADGRIAALRSGGGGSDEKVLPADAVDSKPVEAPVFQLDEGLEVGLWAENPLLSKPVAMNWDAKGRLWVASTPIYPQIQPGAYSTDRIFILEDTKRAGKADKATLFADDLLIPTGVEPQLEAGGGQSAYVGASTELLLLTDRDGDGKADERRVVLSGFGTEDTHHTLHTLHWGVDGRLYMSQSIYIHTHMETPWGVVRLNSGGVLAYDPRTERVEVFAKGLVNTWGHQTDMAGQAFLTDGAGGNGISWAFPGATFAPSEGATGTMPSVSAGSYPKFCSLALVRSPLFPADWQGDAITCDFRAHRMVRFDLKDLSQGEGGKSAYATTDQPDVLKTPDQSFRPIDVKFGPDGALYVADWTNPVINHGEVDFRDPRRDKTHGRIWRIAPKGARPVAWEALTERSTRQLLDGLLAANKWEQEQSKRLLASRLRGTAMAEVSAWEADRGTGEAALHGAFARSAAGGAEAALKGFVAKDAAGRAWEARWLGAVARTAATRARLAALAEDGSARVRLEAMRALARAAEPEAAEGILKAAAKAPEGDPQYAFAVARSIREIAPVWIPAVMSGSWAWKGREGEFAAGLRALDAVVAGPVVASVLRSVQLGSDLAGPWVDLIAHAGGADEVQKLWDVVSGSNVSEAAVVRGLEGLRAAALRGQGVRQGGEKIAGFVGHTKPAIAALGVQLAGAWKRTELSATLGGLAEQKSAVGEAAAQALGAMGGEAAAAQGRALAAEGKSAEVRRRALAILLKVKPADAGALAKELLKQAATGPEGLAVWRVLTSVNQGFAEKFARESGADLGAEALKSGRQAAQELGGRGRGLMAALTPSGAAPASNNAQRSPADWAKLVQERGNAARGERIYHSATMTCVQCHAIGGAGGKLGPDMSTLGASAPLDYVIESVLNPAAKVKEGYHGVSYSMTDGGAVVGVPFEENAQSVRVRMPGGVEMDLAKAKIKSSEVIGSLMPAGLVEGLSEEDKINLFAFLGSVGRPGAFDASNGGVARAWRVVSDVAAASKPEALQAAPSIYSLTDGRLLPEHWQMAVGAVQGGTLHAVTRVDAGSGGKVRIEVQGAPEFFVDGERVQGPVLERALSAGSHVVSVPVKRDALPAVLKVTASSARFVAP
jgi:putative heme-binding domain-containing protein